MRMMYAHKLEISKAEQNERNDVQRDNERGST
jgi:hypothetical protein